MRVVSLLASATEFVHALGVGHRQVGRSHECDHPADVRALPAITSPKFPTDGTSYQIDQRIKAIVQEGLSVYRVDAEALDALRPDLVLTQTQCEVCAVSESDVQAALAACTASRPRIVSLHPNRLDDVWRDAAKIADALGVSSRGVELVASMKGRMAGIAGAARDRRNRPTVACVEWIDPLMAAGNWMPELVEMAGGISLFGETGEHSPWLTWEALRAADPDVVFVSPCGFDLATTRREMGGLTAQPGWQALRAVREGRVWLADGNQFFHRPGPRLVESLEILARVLRSEAPRSADEARSWERWTGAG